MSANDSTPEGNATPATSSENSGRYSNGRFAPGNAGGPGNPYARKVAALRKALIEAVTEEDVREIAKVLIEKAKDGSTAAIKLIFQYVIAKPGPDTDPDRLQVEDWQLPLEASGSPEASVAAQRGSPRSASGKLAAPLASVPASLVDRLALAGLGAEHVSILGGGPRLPNGEIGPQGGGGKDKPRQQP